LFRRPRGEPVAGEEYDLCFLFDESAAVGIVLSAGLLCDEDFLLRKLLSGAPGFPTAPSSPDRKLVLYWFRAWGVCGVWGGGLWKDTTF
jgi:hypothetical protein